mgnify:CR=1 FL=1
MDGQYLENIKKGMKVTILTSQKRSSTGIVEELAARTPFHEQGIMVRLKSGEVGRVKKIILSEPQENEKIALQVKKLLEGGESLHTEFKAEAFWSLTYNPTQLKESKSFEIREYGTRASKVIIAKSIAALLNSEGGSLAIGIKENKEGGNFEIVGIEEDMKKTKEPGTDSYKRTVIDEVIRAFFPSKIFNHLNDYITFEFLTIEGKTICWIKIKRSDSRVFLKLNEREVFMIRVDSQNRTLEGEKLVDYCIRKWGAR